MIRNQLSKFMLIFSAGIAIIILTTACSPSSNLTSTPTPTLNGGGFVPLPTITSVCEGLAGTIEMQVLVGPSEVVGLEPIAIGSIPFSVASAEGANLVEGSGDLSYQDVLEQEWGTYTVNFDQVAAISGVCEGNEQSGVLNLVISTAGEQLVEVISEGFQAEYPWSGTQEFNLSLPIEEGTTGQGEGWTFVLHLSE
jgi:hypothetical protein